MSVSHFLGEDHGSFLDHGPPFLTGPPPVALLWSNDSIMLVPVGERGSSLLPTTADPPIFHNSAPRHLLHAGTKSRRTTFVELGEFFSQISDSAESLLDQAATEATNNQLGLGDDPNKAPVPSEIKAKAKEEAAAEASDKTAEEKEQLEKEKLELEKKKPRADPEVRSFDGATDLSEYAPFAPGSEKPLPAGMLVSAKEIPVNPNATAENDPNAPPEKPKPPAGVAAGGGGRAGAGADIKEGPLAFPVKGTGGGGKSSGGKADETKNDANAEDAVPEGKEKENKKKRPKPAVPSGPLLLEGSRRASLIDPDSYNKPKPGDEEERKSIASPPKVDKVFIFAGVVGVVLWMYYSRVLVVSWGGLLLAQAGVE